MSEGVASDPAKIEAIVSISVKDLMENDVVTPSVAKTRSFLSMVVYYQHFIEHCSSVAKPLFQLFKGQKRLRMGKRSEAVERNPSLFLIGLITAEQPWRI